MLYAGLSLIALKFLINNGEHDNIHSRQTTKNRNPKIYSYVISEVIQATVPEIKFQNSLIISSVLL